jgi:hypothetical protein
MLLVSCMIREWRIGSAAKGGPVRRSNQHLPWGRLMRRVFVSTSPRDSSPEVISNTMKLKLVFDNIHLQGFLVTTSNI